MGFFGGGSSPGLDEAAGNALWLRLDGTNGPMTGPLAMGTNKITGLGDPSAAQDAATKNWVDTNFYTQAQLDGGQLDSLYFQESEFLNVSAGAADAGKPIKLDAGGHIDASMINDADIDHDALTNFVANEHIDWTQASAGTIHATNYVDNDTTDHTLLSNIGVNSHATIDSHIADATIHFTEASIDHGSIAGLADDDHTQYLLINGTRAMTGNLDTGGNKVIATAAFSLESNANTDQIKLNTDGTILFDGATLEGPTSGVSTNLLFGNPPAAVTGGGNTAFGVNAGSSLIGGTENSIFGHLAGNSLTSASENCIFGDEAARLLATGNSGVYIGTEVASDATSASAGVIAIGHRALDVTTVIGTRVIAIGQSAGQGSTGARNIFLGRVGGINSTGSNNIIIGNFNNPLNSGLTDSAAWNECIIGGNDAPITDVYFGEGGSSSSPGNVTLHVTNADGTDIAGGDLILAAGRPTGAGLGGHFKVQTAPAGATGTTLGTLATMLEITDDAKIGLYGATPVAQAANVGQLTDNTTGTADGTVADVGVSFNQTTLNNNFADLIDKINKLEAVVKNLGATA